MTKRLSRKEIETIIVSDVLKAAGDDNLICLYHNNCMDGLTSAALLYSALHGIPHNTVFVPYSYGKPVPFDGSGYKKKTLIMLDFSFKRDDTLMLSEMFEKVIIMDHHESAKKELLKLPDNVIVLFDMRECGASLTKKVFNIEYGHEFIDKIKIRDLWKTKSRHWPEAQYQHFYLLANIDFPKSGLDQNPIKLLNDTFRQVNRCVSYPRTISYGRAIYNYHMKLVKATARTFSIQDWRGYRVPFGSCIGALASDVLNELAKEHPFAVSASITKTSDNLDICTYSLRSSSDNPNAINVAELAAKYGGGGHKHSAGFVETIK